MSYYANPMCSLQSSCDPFLSHGEEVLSSIKSSMTISLLLLSSEPKTVIIINYYNNTPVNEN